MSLLEFYSRHESTKININENIQYSGCCSEIIIHVRETYLQTYWIKFILNTKIHWNYTRDEGGILTSIIQNYNTFFHFSKEMRFIILRDHLLCVTSEIPLHNRFCYTTILKSVFKKTSFFCVWRHSGLVFFFIHLSLLQTCYLLRGAPKTFLRCKIMLGSQTLSKWNKRKNKKSAFWNLNKQHCYQAMLLLFP